MALTRFIATELDSLKHNMNNNLRIGALLGSFLVMMMSCVTSQEDSKYRLLLETEPVDIHLVETRDGNSRRINQRYTSIFHAQQQGHFRDWSHLVQPGRVEKLPWTCECENFWRDLGDDYKPRFIWDARCKRRTCMYGHYSCVPQAYEVNVLRQIRENSPFEYDTRVSNFAFTSVNVTINCLCDRA